MHKATKATLTIGDTTIELPVLTGTEGERTIDISALRKQTGMTTFDPGYVNTAACQSAITFLDGEKGILRHRGYPIEQLVKECEFVEVAYLLVHGALPDKRQREDFSSKLNRHSMLHEDMRFFFRNYPERAHPMAILSSMAISLSTFCPEVEEMDVDAQVDEAMTTLLSQLRTIAAFSYRKFEGKPFVYPDHKLRYCENLLKMMFDSPVEPYELDPVLVRAMNALLIIHADHEQNCSTSAVRLVGSSGANLFASIAAGICALWGPKHGGANQAVIEMLEGIRRDGLKVSDVVTRAKAKDNPFRLMGFGHRVYKTYDPRARIAKKLCDQVLERLGIKDPLLDIALELEQAALADDYFVERKLYPNVDFYTGIVFRAMGIPTDMFTVMFAIGRLPGWIAHWIEWMNDPYQRIGRPRQLYVGPVTQDVVPLAKR
ncbi:MAG: citrate synthase [Candidatus Marinimicrobia bacterium]|nr:citrate synthase [Candidatus Neomarinimicrobiota bacterium]